MISLGRCTLQYLSVLQAGNTILRLEQIYDICWTISFDLVVSKAL